jgi:predicted nucleic acid-binding protein
LERSEIPRYVPDASVAVKWFIEEKESRPARRLRELFQQGRIDLDAPTLLKYEVASALRFHPVARFTPRQLRSVMESLDDLQITREPNDGEWATAFVLSLDNPISIYDAVYVAFAVHGHSQMVTADKVLTTRLRSNDTRQKVTMLADVAL